MNTAPRKIVVVGNGMVGHHFVDEMAKHEGYEITVLSAEDRLAYDRVHLSAVSYTHLTLPTTPYV